MSAADAKKLLASNNLARNARQKRQMAHRTGRGKDGLKLGKSGCPISGWLVGGLVAEIKWVGSASDREQGWLDKGVGQ